MASAALACGTPSGEHSKEDGELERSVELLGMRLTVLEDSLKLSVQSLVADITPTKEDLGNSVECAVQVATLRILDQISSNAPEWFQSAQREFASLTAHVTRMQFESVQMETALKESMGNIKADIDKLEKQAYDVLIRHIKSLNKKSSEAVASMGEVNKGIDEKLHEVSKQVTTLLRREMRDSLTRVLENTKDVVEVAVTSSTEMVMERLLDLRREMDALRQHVLDKEIGEEVAASLQATSSAGGRGGRRGKDKGKGFGKSKAQLEIIRAAEEEPWVS